MIPSGRDFVPIYSERLDFVAPTEAVILLPDQSDVDHRIERVLDFGRSIAAVVGDITDCRCKGYIADFFTFYPFNG